MDFSKFIFRSHMVGKIVNRPKEFTEKQKSLYSDYTDREKGEGKPLTKNQRDVLGKMRIQKNTSPKITDGQKNLLTQLVFDTKYNRKTDINSDKLRKGIEQEKESRDLISKTCGLFLTSNNERRSNDYVTGEIDVKPDNVIIDIKTAYSRESYYRILNSKPNDIYLDQLDSYMDLWDLNNSVLIHTLVDTPFRIVENELRRSDYELDIFDIEGNVRDESIEDVKRIVSNHIFTKKGIKEFCDYSSIMDIEYFNDFIEIPEEERVHMIPHDFSKIRIEQRNESIIKAREFMNKVKPINNFNKQLIRQ